MVVDYSVWLTEDRLIEEERLWEECGNHDEYAYHLKCLMNLINIDSYSVIEFGCGTGRVAKLFQRTDLNYYMGVDSNSGCIKLSQVNAPQWADSFVCCDIRDYEKQNFDITMSFAFMKHFKPDEFSHAMSLFLRHGKYGLFTMPVGKEEYTFDQGFPHLWVTEDQLDDAVFDAGHHIIFQVKIKEGETMVYTMLDA